MNLLLSSLALALTAFSAVVLYAASPHCMWQACRRWRRQAPVSGGLCAMLALAVWIIALGVAVGLCAMLATWMLALISLPYLALLSGTPSADATVAEND
ncbi:hypothetical protein [Rhodanobacter sp. C03]|uniref:hypothetical protein n=1 Tax=Rhodanobacter sp. C03 TaxID=1945858 RepID=UPI000986623B|nr:hypothetical protein [Rhodanobacter sp. C03]OOG57367.1 hypothetical protein B0E48_07925 [Rhodanobacter sp. C03]